MKLSGDEVVQILDAGCESKCKAVDEGIGRAWRVQQVTFSLSNDE